MVRTVVPASGMSPRRALSCSPNAYQNAMAIAVHTMADQKNNRGYGKKETNTSATPCEDETGDGERQRAGASMSGSADREDLDERQAGDEAADMRPIGDAAS